MRRIEIPSAELQVSSYCLGTMYFGSKVPVDTSLTLLDAYADRGGNFLDSANKYASWIEGFSGGESERVIGRWLKDRPRDRFVVTSKVGFPYGDVPRSLRADVIVSECEKSLRRLGTDYIDIYFAHAEDAGTPVEETLRAFDKLIRDGKVRCIGASNHQAWRLAEAELMARAAGLPHYVVLQQRFSYLQPVVGADFGTQVPLTPEQTDFCARHGVLLMAYSPLLGGLYEKPEIPVPVQYRSEHSDKLLELLRRRAAEWGYTPSQLVLGWMLALSPCVVPEVTASRLEHLEANLREVDPAHAAVFAEEVASVDSFTVKYS